LRISPKTGFFLGYLAQDGGEPRLVLRDDPSGLAVGKLGGPLLHRGIGEHPVWIPIPLGVKAGPEVLELHLLQLALVEQLGVPGVVVKHLAMPVFFSGPEVVPAPPEAVVAEIYGQEPMKMRQPLLGQEVQRQRGPSVIGDAGSLLAKLGDVGFGTLVGGGAYQIRWKPELSLALMNFHQLADDVLQVLKHLDF
jgi:hypothetical protein